MNNNYVEIDLLDLCKTALKKWKIILACALICAIIGGVYGFVQMNKTKPETEAQINELTSDMTQEEIDNVKDAAEIINNYRAMYKSQKEYNENSIYQNLNPYSVDALKLSYYVDNHYQVSYPVIEESNNLIPIIQAYVSSFSEDSFYEELANEVSENGNPTYMKELVMLDTEEKESGVLNVTVYASSNDLLVKMGDFIKEKITENQAKIAEVYGDHDVVLASESVGKMVDPIMAETQNKNVERLTAITTSIANEEKLFSGNQLTFLKYLIHEELDEKVSVPKNAVLGLLIGLVLSIMVYCAKYVLSGTVKTESELATLLNATSFGQLGDNNELLISKINNAISVNNCSRVAIVSDNNNVDIQGLIKKVTNAELVTDFLNDKESFEKFVKCDGAIFVEKTKHSYRKVLAAKKKMCDYSSIKLIGFITE